MRRGGERESGGMRRKVEGGGENEEGWRDEEEGWRDEEEGWRDEEEGGGWRYIDQGTCNSIDFQITARSIFF